MNWPDDFKHVSSRVSSGAEMTTHYRTTGVNLPSLVLLHGYPQNSSMWMSIIPHLPGGWSLFIPDLPGYGESNKPISDTARPFSKRCMGQDILEAIDQISSAVDSPLIVVGHDRGARVAYRMALDHPSRVVGCAVLDIVPTIYVWDGMHPRNDHFETHRSHHWVFLASPRPLPETLISHDPEWYYRWTLTSWEKRADPKAEWITKSILPYVEPGTGQARISAACEDYRAGATFDVEDDREQEVDPSKPAKRVFQIPMLSLASIHLCRRFDVKGTWDSLTAPGKHQFYQIGGENTGHFFVNEETEETARRLTEWLKEHWA